MEQITSNQTKNLKFSNGIFSGIQVNAILQHGTANTAFDLSLFDPSQIDVRVTLKRNGQNKQIMSDKLDRLNAHLNIANGGFSGSLFGGTVWDTYKLEKVTAATGVDEVNVKPYYIPFLGNIHCRGNDVLEVQIFFGSSAITSALDSAASYIQFDVNEGSAPEYYVPITVVEGIDGGSPSETLSVNHLVQASFLNTDKTTIKTADQVLDQAVLSVQGKGVQYANNSDELINLRHQILNGFTVAEAEKWYQTFPLYGQFDAVGWSGTPNAKISLTLDASNVTSGKNFIAYTYAEFDPSRMELAALTDQKREVQFKAKVGLMDSGSASAKVGAIRVRQNQLKS